jgi:carbamoyl-phosphate synthase large subunit
MLGTPLSDLNLKHKKIPYFGVKESVFPFNMFPEVDPLLGPEMRSTGEVLGLADSAGLAFFKAQEATQQLLPTEGTVLITVAQQDKEATGEFAKIFEEMGFRILATEGTQALLSKQGVKSEAILKMHEGRPNIVDAIKNHEVHLIINTPVGKLSKFEDSYIRKAAIKYKVPYITTTSAALASARGIQAKRKGEGDVKPLQAYHADIT